MEDYYKLLGVQPDDARDAIRDAYRAKKAEFDEQGTDAARSHASRLNRAWNVLSDDLQRSRYDDQLADAKAEGTVEETPDFEVVAEAPTRGRGRGRNDRPARQPIPQETEINGVALASNKDRGFAFAIDAFILFALLIIAFQQLPTAAEALVRDDWKAYDAQVEVARDLEEPLSDAEDAFDEAKDELRDAESDDAPAEDIDSLQKARDEAEDKRDDAKDAYDAEVEKANKLFDKVVPIQRLLMVGWTVVALLLTVVPSALGGQTLGKRLRRIRLMSESGAAASWRESLLHFGVPIGTMGISGIFAPALIQIVGLVWMFGVTSFARNPRRQGWHDRLAKTVVAAG